MSKVTPPTGAGDERLTVKVKFVVPALPSFRETSLIDRLTPAPPPCGVTEKSSTARPWSAPEALVSVQRSQNCRAVGDRAVTGIVEDSAVRLARGVAVLGAGRVR